MAPEALEALGLVREDIPGAGLLHVTSADRLDADWRRRGRRRHAPRGCWRRWRRTPRWSPCSTGIRRPCPGWARCSGHRVRALGVDRFGQSADLTDLYRVHGLDAGAILDACAAALLRA